MARINWNYRLKNFRWRTKNSQYLALSQMETKHLFNSMKLVYGRAAEFYHMPTMWGKEVPKQRRGRPVEFRGTAREYAQTTVLFLKKIEQRGNLHPGYAVEFETMKDAIMESLDFYLDAYAIDQFHIDECRDSPAEPNFDLEAQYSDANLDLDRLHTGPRAGPRTHWPRAADTDVPL